MGRVVIYLLILFVHVPCLIADDRVPVFVTLRPESTVNSRVVRASDIAEIVGGDSRTRKQIEAIDLAEASESQSVSISQSFIALRLRLAGISPHHFHLGGPPMGVVRWDENALKEDAATTAPTTIAPDRSPWDLPIGTSEDLRGDRQIVDVAERSLAKLWKVERRDVEVRLARPLSIPVRELLDSEEGVSVRPFLPNNMTAGTNRLSFGIYRDGVLVLRSTAMIEASLIQRVAVATAYIRPRDALSPENVIFERQPTTGRAASHAAMEVYGKVAARSLRKGQLLLISDVREPVVVKTPTDTVIKRGDLVRVVAGKSGLKVSIRNCEALENGSVGETIRIRNRVSRRTLAGRVVEAGYVEVSL